MVSVVVVEFLQIQLPSPFVNYLPGSADGYLLHHTSSEYKFTDSSVLLLWILLPLYNMEAGNHNGLFGVNSDEGLTGKGATGRSLISVERVLESSKVVMTVLQK